MELGVVIGKAGSNIKEENAFKHIAGYALALDLTARDLQVHQYFFQFALNIYRIRPKNPGFHGHYLRGLIHFVQLGTNLILFSLL